MAPLREEDPLSRVLAPPPSETAADREARLLAEAEAKRISDAIDEELQQQAKVERKGPKPTKMLLLAERASWRAVIQLNVVRSIRLILDAISDVQALQASSNTSSPKSATMSLPGSPPSSGSSSPLGDNIPKLTPEHLKLRLRLLPLLQVEESLIRKLTLAGTTAPEATRLAQINSDPDANYREKEVAVNSHFVWKGMFSRIVGPRRDSLEEPAIEHEDLGDPAKILSLCREDMTTLWNDPTIQAVLEFQKLRLQDLPGFFLDSLDRVASLRYLPTDDDILRARLKTLGVSEYRFQVKDSTSPSLSREWRLYDVGGHRSLVTAWAPFFDDMDAILFLAPISCFDQVLDEDPMVNRLEDSVLLWKSIVSNPLLSKTSLVLFLNKIDILKSKLDNGIKLGHYIVSYGNRPNDFESASTYLRRKFQQIHKEYSPETRPFYCHFTAVTDTRNTSHILGDVQDTIIRKQLQSSKLVS
ncbi:hypothetical protein PHLGIDRAFT_28734 [Phlebiopsis gigantea 11061_1 CR5-6]|uniref:G-alpha-domain-containing protein n=1 Tax=Phlebiopsis gigantea (strain 11061_1 CR5-6) TaxID=745531 RepID=A0A0C3SDS3_PHLG1|nr:hypothetical protein PHLGIDRAFT_28734 [Phlebiopsis gigantea 11061_1 CR5-6]